MSSFNKNRTNRWSSRQVLRYSFILCFYLFIYFSSNLSLRPFFFFTDSVYLLFFLVNSILYFKFTPHHFQTNTSLPLCWFGEFGIRSTDKPRIDICLYSHLVCLTLHWPCQLLVQGNSVLITLGVEGSIFSELK